MYTKTSKNPVKKITACPLAGESWWLEWIPEQILNKHDVMEVKNEKAIADIFVKITHETSSNWDIRMLPEKN